MKNYILGSGLTGLLAKEILGDEWDIIPFYKSRYYYYELPLADDDIIWSDKIDTNLLGTPILSKRAFSYGGELIFGDPEWIKEKYLLKTEQNHVPKLLQTIATIGSTTCSSLYKQLLSKYSNLLKENSKYKITKIANGKIYCDNVILDYDNIISTIPLDILVSKLPGIKIDLKSKNVYYYHVISNNIDLEGADRVYVVDNEILFYKVNKLDMFNYVFYAHDEIIKPEVYFASIVGDCKILNRTSIDKAFPIGEPPNLSVLDQMNITCIGSNAQWDEFMDISSCINRIHKYRK